MSCGPSVLPLWELALELTLRTSVLSLHVTHPRRRTRAGLSILSGPEGAPEFRDATWLDSGQQGGS